MNSSGKMQFFIQTHPLFKALQSAQRVISRNPMMRMLGNFLFEIDKKGLTISTTDLQTSVSIKLAARTSGKGKIAIPASILMDTLRNLPAQEIEVNIDLNSYSIVLLTDTGKYKIASESAADFPLPPQNHAIETIKLPGKLLRKMIKQTLFAVSKDEMKANMCGVNMVVNDEGITCASTDGHRLVRYQVFTPAPLSTKECSIILPSKPLTLLQELIHEDEEVQMSMDDKHAYFVLKDTRIVAPLIDAKYPDFSLLLKQRDPVEVKANTSEMHKSMKIVQYYANKTTQQVALELGQGIANLKAEDLDFFNAAENKVAIEYQGEPMRVGFNALLLLEMLQNMPSEKVAFSLETPQKAVVLRPVEQEKEEDLLMLIMPVLLK